MVRDYWKTTGGTLVEEFPLVKDSPTARRRLADAVILPRSETGIARSNEISLQGQDVIVVQAKAARLGMRLLGQAVFSSKLIRVHRPRSVLSVALVLKDDVELRGLLRDFDEVQVVVSPLPIRPLGEHRQAVDKAMLKAYWEKVGGTLVERFPIIKRSQVSSARWVDAIILPQLDNRVARWDEVSLEGQHVVVLAIADRLGMAVMGRAVLSVPLFKRLGPETVRSVVLVGMNDSELHPLLSDFPGVEVQVIEPQH